MSINFLLGSYTRRLSEGIYQVQLNSRRKQLENLSLVATLDNPTYLATKANDESLFSIVQEGEQGGITHLVKDSTGHYIRQSDLLSHGAPPAYLAYDADRQFVYSANYHEGEVSVYTVNDQNKLELLDRITHSGYSIHENQASPHPHYSNLTPDGKYLVVCDLGTDELYSYDITDAGKLEEESRLKLEPGSGPRHLTFHPNGQIAYLVAELSSEMIVLDYNQENAEFTEIQRLSTIPESHKGFNSGAALRVSSDGKFLYASNRGHDSIVIFTIDEASKKLSVLDYVPSEGHTPRDFNLDPAEEFLVVGHQDSDNLTLFERDDKSGQLTLVQKDFYAPEIVNVSYFS